MNAWGPDLKTNFYNVQTLLKAVFIVMSLFNMSYTLFVAFTCSLIGVLRICKNPQASREYLTKVLMSSHGQNLFYILSGVSGKTSYLYFSPMVLFFGYGIVEYIKIKFPVNGYSDHIDMVRSNKYFIFETKTKLEILFLIYLIFTLPMDLFGKAIKVFLLAQLLVMKYKMNPEFKTACGVIHAWTLEKTRAFGGVHSAYVKATDWINGFATRN